MKTPNRYLLPAALALLMLATRSDHFGSSLHLPDASLAVFFLAGYYLRGPWVFPLFLGLAGLIDYVAIAHFGVSDFCVSTAYAFLIPAYAAPWAAGFWLRGKIVWSGAALARVAGAWLAGAGLSFLLSNGSFYWLSGRIAEPAWGHFLEQAGRYGLSYLTVPLAYLALAAVLHGLFQSLAGLRPAKGQQVGL